MQQYRGMTTDRHGLSVSGYLDRFRRLQKFTKDAKLLGWCEEGINLIYDLNRSKLSLVQGGLVEPIKAADTSWRAELKEVNK